MQSFSYSYHVWFKVCKPLRGKYKLSTNCLLVLNGAYLLYHITGKPFTRYRLLKFVTYFNSKLIGKYMTVLIGLGYLVESGTYKGHISYIVSSLGNQVINELNENYNTVLYDFCNKYNIVL